MSRPKPQFTPDPRTWNEYQVACRFNKGVEWFRTHRRGLERAGFPLFDELVDGWDSRAIEAWFDRRSGLAAQSSQNEWEEAYGEDHAAVS